MNTRVSVIMGIYNCAETLPEAIDSILSQTYPHWKLIMCNDGSTDNTLEIAKQYQAKAPERIIVIENERNMGLNFTLNHCLEYADTEYVARMDGDDLSLPERLEKEVQFLDDHPEYAIVSCPMIYFDENGDWGKGKNSGEPDIDSLAITTPFCHAPCMVRREAYVAVKGYTVDQRLLRMEDYHLWIKMYAKGFRGFNLNEHLYKMRDDRAAKQRRKFKYRINEARLRFYAIHALKLSPKYYVYVLRPLIVGLLPPFLYDILHKARMKH